MCRPRDLRLYSTQRVRQRAARGEVAAHAVNADAGRRRRRADVEARDRRRVRPPGRPSEELTQIGHAAPDIAAREVLVVTLDLIRPADAAREDAIAKSRRKALDLLFDARQHLVAR